MNNRLKYRAWHKPTKRLFEVWCFTPEYVFEHDEVNGIGSPTNPARMEDCDLTQCTGLKDKHGRLIYEGDILKFAINAPEEDYFHGVVRYSSENWKYELVSGNETFCLCQVLEQDIEVVGNVHENPALLEEK